MLEEVVPRLKCNRCRAVLRPGQAVRDKTKSGYVHKDECPRTDIPKETK